MNSLDLKVVNKTKTGAVHLEVNSSGENLGVLYLSEEQFTDIVGVLRVGCFNKDIDFQLNDPYNIEEEVIEDDLHIIFSLD
jgi:hypothetical protein